MATVALRPPPALLRAWDRYGRHLPKAAEVVLVVLFAHAAAILLWTALPTPAGAAWKPPTATVDPMSGAAGRGPNVAMISGAHLFGQYQPPAEGLSDLSSAPPTNLDLTLLGIFAASADRGSRALIGASNGDERPYAIGDDVTRGVTLQNIFPDRVILARNGKLETLLLDKDAASKAPAPAARPAAPAGTSTLTDIRDQIMNDPSKASQYLRVQPATSAGQMRGYRIYPGRDRSVFASSGLKPGDLVTQVNGIQLTDANTALQMLQQLGQATSLSLVVERGGQQQTVNVNFN